MENSLGARIRHAWNVFKNGSDPPSGNLGFGGFYFRPDRPRLTRGNERSIVTAIYNRIAIDVAALEVKHVKLDENKRYKEEVDSDLNTCLTLEANIDQTSRAFRLDSVISMLNEGVVAIVPIDTTEDPKVTGGFDIQSMRTGKVISWFPRSVVVDVYNDRTGKHQEITVPKKMVALVENPLFSVMNEPNSTLQRLIRKLNLLDYIDDQNSSGKLDLIIQLPYVIKSDARKQQAEARRSEIEKQLTGSKYGIAYTDGTEKITQLNRAIENNLMGQIEYLTKMLYGQLGLTDTIMDGTANEETMLNYYNRTIEPIISAITDEMTRKFLTKNARTRGEAIRFFRDPFKLVPINNIAEIADKFTRNEVLTSNEVRQIIGFKPADDPNADVLKNKNISHPEEGTPEENTNEMPENLSNETEKQDEQL